MTSSCSVNLIATDLKIAEPTVDESELTRVSTSMAKWSRVTFSE